MRLDAERVWSIGTDQVSQGGEVVFDPTNGMISGGDIVARR